METEQSTKNTNSELCTSFWAFRSGTKVSITAVVAPPVLVENDVSYVQLEAWCRPTIMTRSSFWVESFSVQVIVPFFLCSSRLELTA